MKIYSDTTVYVACIANIYSGGPTLLHQLASHLLKRGVNVKIYYYDKKAGKYPVEENYRKYHIPVADEIDDSRHNILVMPETATFFFNFYNNLQMVLWWLSVNNWASSTAWQLDVFEKKGLLGKKPLNLSRKLYARKIFCRSVWQTQNFYIAKGESTNLCCRPTKMQIRRKLSRRLLTMAA